MYNYAITHYSVCNCEIMSILTYSYIRVLQFTCTSMYLNIYLGYIASLPTSLNSWNFKRLNVNVEA